MPFGKAPAPEVFQRILNDVIANLDDVYSIADELVVGNGATQEVAIQNHDQNLRNLQTRCRLNREKLVHIFWMPAIFPRAYLFKLDILAVRQKITLRNALCHLRHSEP